MISAKQISIALISKLQMLCSRLRGSLLGELPVRSVLLAGPGAA